MKTKSKAKPKERWMKYDQQNLKKALDAVHSGMTKNQAAKEFQVPRSTIQFRLKNPEKTNPCPGPTTILTDSKENILANWIIQSSKKGFPCQKEDIQYSVSDFLKKCNRSNHQTLCTGKNKERTKLQQNQTFKGKSKGKKTVQGNIQKIKKNLLKKEFCSSPSQSNEKNKENIVGLELNEQPIDEKHEEQKEFYIFPSTSRGQ